MAFERYIHVKTNRLFIVLARYHDVFRGNEISGNTYHTVPTTVDLLDVAAETKQEVTAKDFQHWCDNGKFTRVED